jgi:hypothetical protein
MRTKAGRNGIPGILVVRERLPTPLTLEHPVRKWRNTRKPAKKLFFLNDTILSPPPDQSP